MIPNNVLEIDVQELKKRMDKDSDLCLIDVRETDEWESCHIPGAKHLPKGSLLEHIEDLMPDKTEAIYLQCQGGTRSAIAAGALMAAGYLEVYSVAGGLRDWASCGYPLIYPKE